MALVSELVTKVTADTGNYLSGMAKALAATLSFAAALATLDNLTGKIDTLGKQAKKLGADFESLQSLQYAASKTDISMEQLQGGMIKLGKTIYEAAQGGEKATETFEDLGLSIHDLVKMPLAEQYVAVSEALGTVTDQNKQLGLAMEAFGKSGADQLLLVKEGVTDLRKEFDSYGVTISESQRQASAAFHDSKETLGVLFTGFASLVAADVAPAFTILMDELTKSITGIDDLKGAARSLASSLVSVVQFGVKGFDIFLTVLDQVRNKIDLIITDIGNAMKRVGMVHQFLVNAVSGAGISVSPSMIGRLNPVDTAPASTLGGNMAGVESRLSDLSKRLAEPLQESFIQPITKAGNSVTQFSNVIQKATSQISGMIESNMAGQASERIQQLLSGSNAFNDQREVYRDEGFETKFRNVFDAINKQQINSIEFSKAIQDLMLRASINRNGEFNAMPNIAAVQDLKKYGKENGLIGSTKQKAELKVFVKTDKGFITEFADRPQFGDAVGKWLEIYTEASN